MVRLLCTLLALFFSIAGGWAQDGSAPERVQVMVKRTHQDGNAVFNVQADGYTHASPQRAWQVLTDYERLPEFVPNLQASKLVSRDGDGIVLEQQSRAGFLFVKQDIHLVLRVTEHPFSAIDITLVSGDMRQYAGRWEIAPVRVNGNDGTRIRYVGQMEPDFLVPPLVGNAFIAHDVKRMVEAVVSEIDSAARDK